ncbi:MAG: hypothetical protein E7314_06755 [Clostridiales bacterium]|nr:hypothetical protein [Clostridiales bacterium]
MFGKVISKPTTETDFRKINAMRIAKENNMAYIPKVAVWQKEEGEKYYARKGEYILLYPPNDGYQREPMEWYSGNGELIMDNQKAFKTITNLSEVILDMICLYTKYIDEDIFISPWSFAVKLEDEVCAKYVGKATLAITKMTIINHKVKPTQKYEIKKQLVNEFLDQYIGWNFGVVIKNNPKLEQALVALNNLVITKGLREPAEPGVYIWESDDVIAYKLPTN